MGVRQDGGAISERVMLMMTHLVSRNSSFAACSVVITHKVLGKYLSSEELSRLVVLKHQRRSSSHRDCPL